MKLVFEPTRPNFVEVRAEGKLWFGPYYYTAQRIPTTYFPNEKLHCMWRTLCDINQLIEQCC